MRNAFDNAEFPRHDACRGNLTLSNRSAKNPASAHPLLLCGLSLLAGCAVGPNYKPPVIDSPSTFRGETGATNGPSAELAWWQIYQDATLQALVR